MSQRRHNEDRIRRAKSWYRRGRRATSSDYDRFIFFWIAFNAAFGDEVNGVDDDETDFKRLTAFLGKIVDKDKHGRIRDVLWNELSECDSQY